MKRKVEKWWATACGYPYFCVWRTRKEALEWKKIQEESGFGEVIVFRTDILVVPDVNKKQG